MFLLRSSRLPQTYRGHDLMSKQPQLFHWRSFNKQKGAAENRPGHVPAQKQAHVYSG